MRLGLKVSGDEVQLPGTPGRRARRSAAPAADVCDYPETPISPNQGIYLKSY